MGARVKLREAVRVLNAMDEAQFTLPSTSVPTPPQVVEPEWVKVPETFLCPISHEIMKFPVVAPDGHTYEEEQIRLWIQMKHTSPITGLKFKGTVRLTPNHSIRSMIMEWTEKYKGRYRD
ncbi:U-box-domain-containing protein [Gonapodya prolifera JEL478]|uniref:U-box-domain-containing protein n=1 Tax=Gonapodya prolifera (strain JEL478) TaxID=1344416 RepID=A0A139AKN1_GONPJ|nr:U-box-domain-containing protein [Gonapodya prolifera JEL478]|eukprot:KXS17339.1 U-box-domain-containing protein [Gonapodya prolifera JEL478]